MPVTCRVWKLKKISWIVRKNITSRSFSPLYYRSHAVGKLKYGYAIHGNEFVNPTSKDCDLKIIAWCFTHCIHDIHYLFFHLIVVEKNKKFPWGLLSFHLVISLELLRWGNCYFALPGTRNRDFCLGDRYTAGEKLNNVGGQRAREYFGCCGENSSHLSNGKCRRPYKVKTVWVLLTCKLLGQPQEPSWEVKLNFLWCLLWQVAPVFQHLYLNHCWTSCTRIHMLSPMPDNIILPVLTLNRKQGETKQTGHHWVTLSSARFKDMLRRLFLSDALVDGPHYNWSGHFRS